MNVVLVGGFAAPPALLLPLRTALRRDGRDVRIAPLGLNLDCGEATVERLEAWLASLPDLGPIALVGHSRGGQLARVLAVRRPDRVGRLVTVATPWALGPPDRPGVEAVARAVRAARRRGLNVMGSIDCATDACCARFRAEVAAKPAARWSALWSSRDRVGGNDARPPAAADRAVDLRTGHASAVTSPRAIAAIAAELR